MDDGMIAMGRVALVTALVTAAIVGSPACSRRPEAKQYPLTGQVLAINRDKQEITIKHEDIPGFMPGMTMSFPVANPALLSGREPGELVTATLEVVDALGKLTSVTRTGMAPLPAGNPMAAVILGKGDAVPDAAFIDQDNKRRSIAEWSGRVMAITFVYARCPLPNYCPLMNQNFAKIQKAIAADAQLKDRAALLSISFDPEHDTPEVLAGEAKHYGADPLVWTFLTGDRPTVDRFAAALGVGLTRTPGTNEIVHNLRTIVVDSRGKIAAIFSSNDWTTAAVIDAMRSAVPSRQP
jgi:protein SCO1